MTMRLFPRRDVMKFFSAVGFAIAMAFLPAAPGEAQERPLKIGTGGQHAASSPPHMPDGTSTVAKIEHSDAEGTAA